MPASDSTLSSTLLRSRDLARRVGVAGFWSWWGRELWAWVPARIQAALARHGTRPVLAFDDRAAMLWQPAAGGRLRMVETARVALDADAATVNADGRAALARLTRNGAAPRVIVALPANAALRKPLTLPGALEENLRQALAYDLDRHTPFRAADLYFDAVVRERDPARRTIQVELVAARKSVVDPLLAYATSFGAEVAAVTTDPPERAAWSKIDLLPDERRAPRHPWLRWQVLVPAVLLVVLIAAALILPLWQKRDEAIALSGVAEQARHRAEATDALRGELESKVGEYNFPLQRKYGYPGTVQLMNDVTRILPDDTWLTQFEYQTGRGKDATHTIVLRGESANAGRLVALLQESKFFTQAAPRSPTTKIQPGPGEIFDIGAQVEPLAAPKPASIDLSAPPPAPPRPVPPPPISPPVPPPQAPETQPPGLPEVQSQDPSLASPDELSQEPSPMPTQEPSQAPPQAPPQAQSPAQSVPPRATPAPSAFGPFPSSPVPRVPRVQRSRPTP